MEGEMNRKNFKPYDILQVESEFTEDFRTHRPGELAIVVDGDYEQSVLICFEGCDYTELCNQYYFRKVRMVFMQAMAGQFIKENKP
jgi:hypothetical protein